jgi:hypothetical protein
MALTRSNAGSVSRHINRKAQSLLLLRRLAPKALSLAIPPTLLACADQVIE